MYDNKYLRYFRGHSEKVVSLSMSPTDDYFLSASMDRTVCLWNLNSSFPIAKLKLDTHAILPYAAFDTGGLVFGVMCQSGATGTHYLKLYDARNYDQGPFANIAPSPDLICRAMEKQHQDPNFISRNMNLLWTHFEFSADGKKVLVNTNSDLVLVCDSFQAETEPVAICSRNSTMGSETMTPVAAAFSPDSRFVLTGTGDNDVQVCDVNNGEIKKTLKGHQSPVKVLACNPVYDMFASACVSTALWVGV
jgi:COMPASS component SWD2